MASYIEEWVLAQGLTMAAVKLHDRTPQMVEVRRRIVYYLRDHGWSLPQIGRFLDRNQSSILNLLRHRR